MMEVVLSRALTDAMLTYDSFTVRNEVFEHTQELTNQVEEQLLYNVSQVQQASVIRHFSLTHTWGGMFQVALDQIWTIPAVE